MYVDVKPKLEAPTQVVTLEAPRPSQIVTSLQQANSNSHIQAPYPLSDTWPYCIL
jgi:hypothetical protein